jgi:endo-1,4-beta-mannosidase
MTNPKANNKKISRRQILPVLGSTLLLPFFGFGESTPKQTIEKEKTVENGEEYHTLLKPDGTTVKVKASTIKNSKVVKKNVSNSSFLNWLNKNFN